MSKKTQQTFEEQIRLSYLKYSEILALEIPQIKKIGFLTIAKFIGQCGYIEIFCGPPEYHAELFIENLDQNKRYGLAELLENESIREWIDKNQQNSNEDVPVKREVGWLFLLIDEVSKKEGKFNWLQKDR